MVIIGAIVRKLMEKELKKQMEKFIQPVLDLIEKLVQPEKGTKFLVTIAGIGAIVYLTVQSFVSGDAIVYSIAAIVILYFGADIFHKLRKKENGQ